MKGLSTQGIYTLELDQVYVELTVHPSTLTSNSSNPVPAAASLGREDMLTYLLSFQMRQHNFVIVGAPGSGKTTLLKHLTMGLALRRGPFRKFNRIPILLFIRDHAAAIAEKTTVTLAEIAADSAQRMGITAPGGWFQRRLEEGRCAVLLDGLDEVADASARRNVAAWVEEQMKAYGGNRFLISSRPFGYLGNPLSGVTVLMVMPFSWEQVERFVRNWYLANEVMSAQKDDEGVRIAAREGANDLLNRLRNTSALSDLAVNPLLLTMITTVHRYRGSLPGRRVELYSEVCEVFLGRRQQARGVQLTLTPAQNISVLQPLAFHMMCTQKREIPLEEASKAIAERLVLVSQGTTPADFLKMIENVSGLLLELENGIYAFAHLTFQEYLAAKHIQKERLESDLASHVHLSWWHETIRLYAALGDASNIVEACLGSTRDPSVPALTLAVECLEEAQAVKPHLREKVDRLVKDGIEHSHPGRRCLAAETMLALRLRRLTRVNDDLYVDSSLITSAEYQLFIDESRAKSDYRQPDHWNGYTFSPGTGQDPIAGVRSSDARAFCDWLSNREPGSWLYQLPDEDFGACGTGQVGYWVLSGERPAPKGLSVPPASKEKPTPIFKRLEKDRDLAHALDLDLDLARALDLDLAHDLDLDLDLAHDHDLAHDLARDLAHDLAHDRAHVRALDLALDRASCCITASGVYRGSAAGGLPGAIVCYKEKRETSTA